MAAPGTKQYNLVVTDADDAKLERLCELYGNGGKYWLAVQFLRYGMRHARKAVRDNAARAATDFPPDEEDIG